MSNLGQTQIFYKVGQTQLTRDPVDPDDPDDPTWLQRWYRLSSLLITRVHNREESI